MAVERDKLVAGVATFAVGGPASVFVTVENRAELACFMAAFDTPVEIDGVPVLVLGKGSNLLVSDAGFTGVVLGSRIHLNT